MNKLIRNILEKKYILSLLVSIAIFAIAVAPKTTFAEGNPFIPTTDTLNTGLTPQIGGQDLDVAAQTLANMTDITGAYYDSSLNRIVFVGKTGGTGSQFNKDDMAVAIKAIFFNNTLPNVNIADDPSNPSGPNALVTYTGGVQNTSLGNVLYNADYKLKQYVIGYTPTNTQITSAVPSYKSVVDRYKLLNPNPINGNQTKFILTPQSVSMKTSTTANAFVFNSVTMQATTQVVNVNNDPLWNQAATNFATDVTTNYDSYAQEVPAFEQAKQLGKIIAILKWISDKNVPTDFQWARDYIPQTVSTPTSVQKVTTPLVNGYSAQGEINYNTPNNYLADDGTAAGLKTSSQAVSTAKEDVSWNFTNGGQQYQAVAVASTAFKSLGAYSTSATDFSTAIAGDMNLSFQREYSSFSNGQSGIGRGWNMLPASVYPNDQPESSNVIICNNILYFEKLAIDTPNGHETFSFSCPAGYSADQPSYHTKVVQNPNESVTLTSSNQTKYQFNSEFQLTAIQDKNNNAINFTYDSSSKLISIADTKSHALTITYNAQNLVSKVQDWTARSVQYGYDTSGNLKTVTDPLGNITTYNYDANSRLTTITNRENQLVLTNTYGSDARVVTQKDAANVIKTQSFDNVNKLVTQTDNLGRVTKTFYDANARILQQTDPASKNIIYTYGVESVPLTETDRNGKKTTFTYDSAGNVTTVTFPDNALVTYTYNAQNRLTKIVDGRYSPSKQTDYTYDAVGNQTQRTEAGSITKNTYDTTGEQLTFTDQLNNITTWTRDNFGNKLTEVDPYTKTTTYLYDTLGRLTKETDANNISTNYTYDANGNVKTIADTSGTITNTYNKENYLTIVKAPNNVETKYAYNPSGSMTSVIDGLNNTTTYGYDSYQNILTQNDALNRTTTNAFNSLNRQTSTTTPLGKATNWQYDANGNITQQTNANNQIINYEYDSLNRLKKIIYPNATTITYNYDSRGNLTSMVDPIGTSTYVYDVFDRMTKATNAYGRIIDYTYDATGNILTIKYPDNKIVTYTYDKNGRMLSVKDWNNKITSYTYNSNGNLATRTYPNTISTTYTYDTSNRLNGIEHKKGTTIAAKFTYARDSLGNITQATPSGSFFSLPTTTSFTYDNTGKVLSQTSQDREGNQTYTYDKVGNRLTKFVDGNTTAYTYDQDNKLITIGADTQSYDNNGNQTVKKNGSTIKNLAYDFENQLSSYSGATYTYDGLGNRMTGKNFDAVRYVNDINGPMSRVLAETGPDNTLHTWYVYGLGVISQGEDWDFLRTYNLEDGLGNTRFETNNNGQVMSINYFDVYGNVTWHTGGDPMFKFAGQYEEDSDIYYMRARYYDPTTGRFLSRDPIAGNLRNPLSQNAYIYGYDNPVNFSDADGRMGEDKIIAAFEWLYTKAPSVGQALFRLLNADGDPTNEVRVAQGANTSINFASKKLLLRHFRDHGTRLGYKTVDEYLKGAQRLVKGGKGIETYTRSNGEKLFYNSKTGEFGSLASDGKTIKTYFKPDGNPAEYWKTGAGKN